MTAVLRLIILLSAILAPQIAQAQLAAAVLPTSRAVAVGGTATAFATIINSGTSNATGCAITLATTVPVTFTYQTTNPSTNAVTGTANTPVNIAAGGLQTFVIALKANAAFSPTNIFFNFACTNTAAAPASLGINTLLMSAAATAPPDVVALAATPTSNGDLVIANVGASNAFAVATINLGSTGTITVSADTGTVSLPVVITICQTNPTTGACLATPSSNVVATIGSNQTPTFAIFVQATACVPFLPGANRVFVRFTNSSGQQVGGTGVSIHVQGCTVVSAGLPLQVLPGQQVIACPPTTAQSATGTVAAQNLLVGGGQPSSGYSWSGFTPFGTSLNPLTGVITGNGSTLAIGNYPFTLTITDQISTVQGNFTLVVQDVPPNGICGLPIFQVNGGIIPLTAVPNVPYGVTLSVVGGTPPYTWTLVPGTGNLPSGLVLDMSTGVVRGTPAESNAGHSFTFTIQVTDSNENDEPAVGTYTLND